MSVTKILSGDGAKVVRKECLTLIAVLQKNLTVSPLCNRPCIPALFILLRPTEGLKLNVQLVPIESDLEIIIYYMYSHHQQGEEDLKKVLFGFLVLK